MDKNIAEQLNKAYEAFRQACMDKDSAVKELKQKTDSYEKQIREQQEQIVHLTSIVTKLKSQLAALNVNRVNTHDQVPVLEDKTRRNGTLLNLNSDQLHEKLKQSVQREKQLKEQLENESIKLKQTEEESNLKEKKFESVITIKEDEIRHLKKQLKEINEAQNCMHVPRYEKEGRSEKHHSSRQELSPGGFPTAAYERDELETVFWGMKEEFHRIRTLAKAQTDQLSKCNLRREPETEIPFSKPIQCSDEQADDLCNPWVKKDLSRDVSHFPSIAPGGMGQDEEENSVESLSKFNVKFPPTDNDSTFLQSSPDTPPISCGVVTEDLLQDQQFNRELGNQTMNFSEVAGNLFEEHGTDPVVSTLHNLSPASKAKTSAHTNTLVQSPLEKAPGFKPQFLYTYGTSMFTKQDNPEKNFPSLEANERTVGAPQQPLWKPYHTQDSDLLAPASADSELDQPGICEFCQKVFPPSLTSREDFLRHLNSHFNLKI
ncbi:TRAF family member-associated NF-kappa-B activator isoform X2 [Hemicordylus capensis]|nr:TRAF family member-associated NF-kappa-B activator isoform X2 [Hemicordylus capensis]XP_053134332.1 TRAF family member-associated NF-kappa-B activator isoform X2 [Hemicordylus capensis]XP_053134341.1 TRAF family member-associated NF-kappa-B activator isoform X2 [Hemicordylus capensis]XP_053134347.1 TRAF family member-associated NF-kappa-B activator isoform X2 [Hemicordylus capensis]XP_053134356.1 TRAF family member-associated NF-kappa-B activator isoform X2 [Hemicordylus capensis]XP_0531343